MKLTPALASLAKNNRPRALEAMIAAWQKTPYPRLADAIDRLDAMLPRTHVDPAAQAAWLKRLKTAEPAELGAVLAAFDGGSLDDKCARLKALRKRGRDPRIASALFALVRTTPWTSNGSRDTWIALFALLAELDDPRVRVGADAARAGWAIRELQRVWLDTRFARMVAEISPIPNETAADRAALDALDVALVALPKPARPAGRDTTAMLAAIYADPQDDQLRSVYADALLEAGDPRGELIQLQLQPPTKDSQRRIAELLKEHGRTWLGPIAPVVAKEGMVFTRGFLSACRAKFKNEKDARAYGSDPMWSTVETLEHSILGAGSREYYRWYCWIDPVMRSLAEVRLFEQNLDDLLAAPVPWNIRRLEIVCDTELLLRLGQTDKLPKLEKLAIGEPPPDWLAKSRLASQVRELAIDMLAADAAPWLRDATALRNLEQFAIAALALRRDDAGQFTIGTITLSRSWAVDLAELGELPADVLTSLTVVPGTGFTMKLTPAFQRKIIDTLRPQSRLTSLDLTAIGGSTIDVRA